MCCSLWKNVAYEVLEKAKWLMRGALVSFVSLTPASAPCFLRFIYAYVGPRFSWFRVRLRSRRFSSVLLRTSSLRCLRVFFVSFTLASAVSFYRFVFARGGLAFCLLRLKPAWWSGVPRFPCGCFGYGFSSFPSRLPRPLLFSFYLHLPRPLVFFVSFTTASAMVFLRLRLPRLRGSFVNSLLRRPRVPFVSFTPASAWGVRCFACGCVCCGFSSCCLRLRWPNVFLAPLTPAPFDLREIQVFHLLVYACIRSRFSPFPLRLRRPLVSLGSIRPASAPAFLCLAYACVGSVLSVFRLRPREARLRLLSFTPAKAQGVFCFVYACVYPVFFRDLSTCLGSGFS